MTLFRRLARLFAPDAPRPSRPKPSRLRPAGRLDFPRHEQVRCPARAMLLGAVALRRGVAGGRGCPGAGRAVGGP